MMQHACDELAARDEAGVVNVVDDAFRHDLTATLYRLSPSRGRTADLNQRPAPSDPDSAGQGPG